MLPRRAGALVLLLGCLTAVAALAAGPQCDQKMGASDTVFCNGTYALCIKAPCKAVAGDASKVSCSCVIEQGWSMGPGACTDPGRSRPYPPPSGTEVMSTYSNYFNTTEQTLTCKSSDTKWAWCFGAPCKVDAKDPKRATCLCPVCTGAASTLGGSCHQEACKEIYSAATPINDAFANKIYYDYLTHQGISVPPAATACPSGQPSPH